METEKICQNCFYFRKDELDESTGTCVNNCIVRYSDGHGPVLKSKKLDKLLYYSDNVLRVENNFRCIHWKLR